MMADGSASEASGPTSYASAPTVGMDGYGAAPDALSRSTERSQLAAATAGTESVVETPRGFDDATARDYETEVGHGFTLPGERMCWEADVGGLLRQLDGQLPSSPRVLDVGCGTGKFTRLMRDALTQLGRTPMVDGVDAAPAMLEVARTLDCDRISYTLADARQLDLPGGYDMVVSCQVLDSFENPSEVLAHWQGLLRPGGHLLTVLAFSKPTGWTNRTADELSRMPLAQVTSVEPLTEAVVRAGYQHVRAEFLPTVSALHGGATTGTTGPVGSRYYALAASPSSPPK